MSVTETFNGGNFNTYDDSPAEAYVSAEVPSDQSVEYEFSVLGRNADGKTYSRKWRGGCKRDAGGSLQNVPLKALSMEIDQINLSLATLAWDAYVVLRSDKKIAVVVKGGDYDVRWQVDGVIIGISNP